MLKVALVAGETSGDLLAGLLLDGLLQRWPTMTSAGIGGAQMTGRGFDAWWPADRLAVSGYGWEVLRRYRELLAIRNQLKARWLQQPPDVFIGVDAPDFNLDLERSLKDKGIKTVHFVSPSVWAWRPERVEKIRRSVDHVLCIFPFEPALLAASGIAATYVGHPLANIIPMLPDRGAARSVLRLADSDCVLAILPGSRQSEIEQLAPRFFQAAVLVRKARPEVRFVVPAVPALKARIEALGRASGLGAALQIVAGQSHTVLAACDATLIASGTATLEAALFKRPMVISYHVGALSWLIMRRKQLQPWVGLPNILLQEFAVPELIQDAATPQALATAVLGWLDASRDAPEKITALQQKFSVLHQQLQRDTSRIAADAIEQVLQG